MSSAPRPFPVPDPYFKPGAPVEISSDEDGLRGSWYTATILHRVSKFRKGSGVGFLVKYDNLTLDDAGTKPLRETVDLMQLRPLPPREPHRVFKFSEEVDAYYNDGWWEGVITEVLGNGRFGVYFRVSKEQFDFDQTDLRLHREWVNGDWVPALEEDEPITSKVEGNEATVEKFKNGTLVEVSSDEDGFQGAWFAATVIESAGMDKFLIEYQNLRTDDDTEFLREEIDALHIRPCPPETNVVDSFNRLEEVDAFCNDGWWVGVISKVLRNSKYIVYFKATEEEIEFHHSELRLHQDWINDKWVIASQALKL